MSIRFVVLVDIDVDSVFDAYPRLYEALNTTRLEWESSDEWYLEGEQGDVETLQDARMCYFDSKGL